jgi:adenine-specific DNA-methyltransferase
MAKKASASKTVEAIKHDEATRKNIPTAEYQSVLQKHEQDPIVVAYERRNKDLDPQLVWRGKDIKDWSDLIVQAPPLYIQEKVHPKALIDDLLQQSKEQDHHSGKIMADLFSDFNGIPKGVDKTEFYKHDQNWSNRMILGDSLQVMASLAEREGLRGKVQSIYVDPPYGIKFNSNFQWSTTSRDVKDGRIDQITREPEQVKAFRDTWRDGINSYLTYLRDRLTVARDLLTDSGSIFIQIGSENQHLVRALCDEIFGVDNFMEVICFKTRMALGGRHLEGVFDYIIWYSKNKDQVKFRKLFYKSEVEGDNHWNKFLDENLVSHSMSSEQVESHNLLPEGARIYQLYALYPVGPFSTGIYDFEFEGKTYSPPPGRSWKSPPKGMHRLALSSRIEQYANGQTLRYRLFLDDYPVSPRHNIWTDTAPPTDKIYVVQTALKIIDRCLLMTTDPGDLVLDPTCGSGTTAYVAEQRGRRWITIDTSRVALALSRARIMGARYPYYLLADSREGQLKDAEITRTAPSTKPVSGNIRHGFIYERVAHVTLKSIVNNAEIDIIWNRWQEKLESLRQNLNTSLNKHWLEWEIPKDTNINWPNNLKQVHSEWWQAKIARQKEIDKSIASKADFEYLFDKPYSDSKKIRVAGPFTVESLSPHRTLGVDENDELIDPLKRQTDKNDDYKSFTQMILDNLKTSGVQQIHKEDKINFSSLMPWPGDIICGEGRYLEGDKEKRAAIFVGPEFGTVQRIDLVSAAREAGDAGFDVLIACAFNYEAHTTEFNNLGRIPILKARMNADLYMSDDLKNTGKGNLFVIFGEPDIDVLPQKENKIQVKVNGVVVFRPNTGEVEYDNADGIACWFIDTDYNEESFFVRHAYFLGANDPYNALKTTLKAEINKEAWDTLHSDLSRPFPKPKTGRIAVKVINHLGDEVLKVFKIA